VVALELNKIEFYSMKHTFLFSLAAMALMTGLTAQAQNYGCTNNAYGWTNNPCGGTNNPCGGTNHYGGGCRQEFSQTIVLSPAASAPTNAAGVATLEADADDETNGAELKVSLTGLDAGTYNVSVTDVTGTNTFDLGTVDVNPVLPDLDDNERDGFDCGGTNAPVLSTNVVNFGRGEFTLPTGLDPTNVAFLFVYDTNSVVDLTGDFTSLSNITAVVYNSTVAVIPGSASQAQGEGTLTLTYKKGKTTSSFKLNAAGLPPKQTLYLKANGVTTATTSTTTKGALQVKTLPHANLANLQLLEAKDKKGNVVFSLKF
jgi:hypothetical protein